MLIVYWNLLGMYMSMPQCKTNASLYHCKNFCKSCLFIEHAVLLLLKLWPCKHLKGYIWAQPQGWTLQRKNKFEPILSSILTIKSHLSNSKMISSHAYKPGLGGGGRSACWKYMLTTCDISGYCATTSPMLFIAVLLKSLNSRKSMSFCKCMIGIGLVLSQYPR